MCLDNSEFQAIVCAPVEEKNMNMSVRLGSAKSSVQFVIGDDCVKNRKINNPCRRTRPAVATQPRPVNESVCC
jgi:hypothetical protein